MIKSETPINFDTLIRYPNGKEEWIPIQSKRIFKKGDIIWREFSFCEVREVLIRY